MRTAGRIETAGKDQACFRLRFGGVDLKPAKDEVRRYGLANWRQAARNRRETSLKSREKISAQWRSLPADEIECRDNDRDDGHDRAADHEIKPIVTAHVVPPSQCLNSLSLRERRSNSQ